MEAIVRHSLDRAAEEAVRLWALGSAQFPKRHGLIVEAARVAIVEAISSFALNARRAIEVLPKSEKFSLGQPRWHWAPARGGEVVTDLWDALNRIIHARKLEVGFVELPANVSVIDGGALVVPFVQTETDRKASAFIDTFAVSHAFLYQVLPRLQQSRAGEGEPPSLH